LNLKFRSLHKVRIRCQVIKQEDEDIEQDLQEFANYILGELKQSQVEINYWDEILRKWKLIEKKKDLDAGK